MTDQTVVVTGASRGLGAAVARAFAATGAHVVCSSRNRDDVAAVVEGIEREGGDATAVRADVRDEFDVERLMETAARVGGHVDVVVANAATNHGTPGDSPLDDTSYAAFDDTFRTNARGVFTTIREALPHMPDDGRVVVPSGEVAHTPRPAMGAYAPSKAAAEAIARGFATDVTQTVGVVDPGLVATDLTDGAGHDPDDVAPLVVWAASECPAADLDGGRVGRRQWRDATN